MTKLFCSIVHHAWNCCLFRLCNPENKLMLLVILTSFWYSRHHFDIKKNDKYGNVCLLGSFLNFYLAKFVDTLVKLFFLWTVMSFIITSFRADKQVEAGRPRRRVSPLPGVLDGPQRWIRSQDQLYTRRFVWYHQPRWNCNYR